MVISWPLKLVKLFELSKIKVNCRFFVRDLQSLAVYRNFFFFVLSFLFIFFSSRLYLTLIRSRLTLIKLVVCLVIFDSFLLLVTYIELDVTGRQLCFFVFLSLSVSVRSGVELNLAGQLIVTNS